MSREQINNTWEKFCQEFLPQKPSNFSPENYLFKAEQETIPDICLKHTRPEDHFEALFANKNVNFRRKENFECSESKLKELTDFLNSDQIRLGLGYELNSEEPFHVIKDKSILDGRDVWFLGDIHGDIFALRSAIAFINSNSARKPIYVFLGDLFDRNLFSLNVLMDVISLIKNNPDSVFWISGNHDEGLFYKENYFASTVMPQEFTEYLNLIDVKYINDFIKAVISLIKKLPVGLVLPNGLLAVHGGIPTRPERTVENVWKDVSPDEIPSLLHAKRREFSHNRFDGTAMSGSKIKDFFSWLELINFSVAIEEAYGIKIQSCLRGHDHCDLCRHEWSNNSLKEDKAPQEKRERIKNVLTMTTISLVDSNEKRLPGFGQQNFSYPSVARWLPEEISPRVYSLIFKPQEIASINEFANTIHAKETSSFVQSRMELLQQQERFLQERLNDVTPKRKNLETKVSEVNAQLQEAEKRTNEARESLDRLKTAAKNLANEIDTLKGKVDEAEKEKDRLVQIIEKAEGSEKANPQVITINRPKLQKTEGNIDKYKKEYDKKHEEYEENRSQLASSEAGYNKFQKKFEDMKQNSDSIFQEYEKSKAEELQLSKEHSNLTEKISDCKSYLEQNDKFRMGEKE